MLFVAKIRHFSINTLVTIAGFILFSSIVMMSINAYCEYNGKIVINDDPINATIHDDFNVINNDFVTSLSHPTKNTIVQIIPFDCASFDLTYNHIINTFNVITLYYTYNNQICKNSVNYYNILIL